MVDYPMQNGSPPSSRGRRVGTALLLLAAAPALYAGWRLFWFLTDDAYIAFRYVSNSVLGYGYTWNLPPFQPVEGYTSFLWVLLLDGVWRVAGVEPPTAANWLSLLFAAGTLALGAWLLERMALTPALAQARLALLALVLLGALSNRTFLAWSSSGLETAMFNFFLTAWLAAALLGARGTDRWLGWLATTAVLAALSRPDGLLCIAATLYLAGLTFVDRVRNGRFHPRALFTLTPLLLPAAHFLWRYHTYGAWLPNTHAAKAVVPWWPESGLRYLLAFIMEYSLWFWLLPALLLLWRLRRVRLRQFVTLTPAAAAAAAAGVTLAHLAYYTLIIGGDFMEYRVYSHLILLIFLSTVWLLNRLQWRARAALLYLALFVLASWPIPWSHWAATRQLTSRAETFLMFAPVAGQFPAPLRPYVRQFDALQEWLIARRVGLRHQEHKAMTAFQLDYYPDRAWGRLLNPDGLPVIVIGPVGAPGWVLPTSNIVDAYGLNDAVIAHNPVDPRRPRQMAHDRYPPPGYVECYRPNLKLVAANKFVVAARALTAADVAACATAVWPPGVGDEAGQSNLAITAANAPAVDAYLWEVWPADPLYLHYTPPEQDAAAANNRLLAGFPAYEGFGCLLLPPAERAGGYLFAFLAARQRPPLAALAAPFPWTQLVSERLADPDQVYHLGYAAPMTAPLVAPPQNPQTAVWPIPLTLDGYHLPRRAFQPGEAIPLTLYWQAGGPVPPALSVAVHLTGPLETPDGGRLWSQFDGDPCLDLYPMTRWQDETILSSILLPLPAEAPNGRYALTLHLYDWQTGERFPLRQPADADQLPLAFLDVRRP